MLCAEHEELAKVWRRRAGLPVREAVVVKEEPDD